MTTKTFTCTKCGEHNEIEVIEDVDDVPEDDFKRLEKLFGWQFSSQQYEHLWDQEETYRDNFVLQEYRLMLEDPQYASDIRLFVDEILYTKWMSFTMEDRINYDCIGSYTKLMRCSIERYKQTNPNFIREISTTRLHK